MGKYLAGFLASVSTLAITSFAAHAGALPSHGHFVSGQGSIAKGNQSLTVKQSSTTGIIDWNSFSVGKKSGVTFDNGNGATLNRVTGGNLSTIAGSLHATGSLYLMNSSGVIVSGTGHIVTGGSFVASSGNIANAAFGDGDQRFKAGSGSVVNKGTITSGSSASLLGRNVSDSGSIRASSVELSATHNLGISGSVIARQANGAGGMVTARGRTIVIGTTGDIDASAVATGQKGGAISVVARGTTNVAGSLKALGGDNGTGGFIDTSGEHVHIADSANISTLAANGKTGTWLIDPKDFTIAASGGDITGVALSTQLGSNDVLIQSIKGSKSGNGDIFVDAAVSWSSGHTLTLDSYRNIVFNAAIKLTGAGGLVLIDADHTQTSGTPGVNDGNAADGDLIFNTGGSVAFTDVMTGATQGTLTINGTNYLLENNIASLASAIANNAFGDYALANNYNASSDNGGSPYSGSPIGTDFKGTFEGLGNTISNLTVAGAGLFAEIGATTGAFPGGGTVRDITLANANITDGTEFENAGLLAGTFNAGTIENVHTSGTVATTNQFEDVGGLVGFSLGTIVNSSSSATVTGSSSSAAGGLIGAAGGGTLTNDFATGSVGGSGTYDGGFAGAISFNSGSISVTNSYATGNMTGSATFMGGFAGVLGGNGGTYTVMGSYATGSVSGGDTYGGGFAGSIGGNGGSVIIADSYATGNASSSTFAGGFAGVAGGNGGTVSISDSFAIGKVSAGVDGGGFVGSTTGTLTKDYWDTETSGFSTDGGGAVGLTTSKLEAQLPSGFANATWGIVKGKSLPYLTWQFSGTPQAVSGIEVSGFGGSGLSGATVSLMQKGADLGGSATTYANGFYYFLLAPGTIQSTSSAGLIVYDATNHAVGFADQADGSITGLDLTEGFLNETTSQTTLSSVTDDLQKALKGSSVVAKLVKKAANREIDSTGSFMIDQTLALGGGTVVISAAKGTVSETKAIKTASLLLEGLADFELGTEANSVATLAKKGAGGIDLKDAHALVIGSVGGVNGVVSSGDVLLTTTTGGIDIEQLIAASGQSVGIKAAKDITESGAGGITAATLSGTSKGAVALDGTNAIGSLDGFTTAGGDFSLTDNHKLRVTGDVSAGRGTLSLTTTGTNNDLDIESIIKGASVNLVTTGEASETAAGSIVANKLNVTAATGIKLTSKTNQIKKLGTDQTIKGPNKVTL